MTRDSRPFLSPSKTAEYSRSSMGYALGSAAITGTVASPVFLLAYCEIMRRDPQIEFGTGIIMAPLYTVTWTVKCERPEVAAYVDRTLHTFWKSLARLEWLVTFGHVGAEVEWKEENGLIELARLKDFHPNDCRPLVWQGKLCGVVVKGVRGEERIAPPRAVWGVSRPEAGSWYGRGRMQGPYLPWLEKSGRHGALDVRRSWAIRCAFDGGTMYYPPGTTLMEDGVTQKPNQDIAREIIEKKETGGVLALPNTTTEDGGKKAWEYVPPVINGSFVELLEYPKGLDVEILKGMNIPPEVVQAAETGSGWSGRSVPFLVFLTGEDQLADTLVQIAKEQVIDHGVEVNFGPVPYTIELLPLAKLAEAPPPGTEPPKPGAANPTEEKPVVAHQPPRPANLSAEFDESKHPRAPVQLAAEPPSLPPAPVEIPAVVPATFYARTLGMMERMFRRQRREAKP